jgi:hypothetical protein
VSTRAGDIRRRSARLKNAGLVGALMPVGAVEVRAISGMPSSVRKRPQTGPRKKSNSSGSKIHAVTGLQIRQLRDPSGQRRGLEFSSVIGLVTAGKWLGKDEHGLAKAHSDKEKFCNDLNGPKTLKMSERPLKTLQDFPTSILNTVRRYPVSGRAFRVRCIANACPEKAARVIKVRRSVFLVCHPTCVGRACSNNVISFGRPGQHRMRLFR